MSMDTVVKKLITTMRGALLVILAAICLIPPAAQAVPSFARQTGQACIACHVSFPELTPYGRLFKLTGYTIGQQQGVPLAVMGVVSQTSVANDQGIGPSSFPKNNDLVFEGGSVFLAGKASEHIGGFIQWTYNNLNQRADGSFGGHSNSDNTDIRWANRLTEKDMDLIIGFTVHNNPTVQDVWNSTPAFGFPFQKSGVAGMWAPSPPATQIEGGLAQAVAGTGAYAFWNKTVYAELTAYHKADGLFAPFHAGQDWTGATKLQGYNPYWRLLYNREWDASSASVGIFGMNANEYIDTLGESGAADHFQDRGYDAQYQYITDPHTITAQFSYIREKQLWDVSHVGNDRDNPESNLSSLRAKLTYYYERKYGATVSYFSTKGSTDFAQYGALDPVSGTPAAISGSLAGKPDAQGTILELNYVPVQNVRIALQYTRFTRYNGASVNYDGNGRNASDNNTMYLYSWFAF